MDWDDFPVILGQGSVFELRDNGEPAPRLLGLRSVSQNAAYAMRKPAQEPVRRPVGFLVSRERK